MTDTKQRPPQIVYVLFVLCVLMTGANGYLLHVNKSLRTLGSRPNVGTPTGKIVAAISGLDFNNRPVSISTSKSKSTILLVYSPTCPYCETTWPAWSTLVDNTFNHDVKFIAVDLTSKASADFVAKKHAERAYSLHRMDPRQLVELNLALTPETILIGADSAIKKVWNGPLSPDDVAQIKKLLNA